MVGVGCWVGWGALGPQSGPGADPYPAESGGDGLAQVGVHDVDVDGLSGGLPRLPDRLTAGTGATRGKGGRTVAGKRTSLRLAFHSGKRTG